MVDLIWVFRLTPLLLFSQICSCPGTKWNDQTVVSKT